MKRLEDHPAFKVSLGEIREELKRFAVAMAQQPVVTKKFHDLTIQLENKAMKQGELPFPDLVEQALDDATNAEIDGWTQMVNHRRGDPQYGTDWWNKEPKRKGNGKSREPWNQRLLDKPGLRKALGEYYPDKVQDVIARQNQENELTDKNAQMAEAEEEEANRRR